MTLLLLIIFITIFLTTQIAIIAITNHKCIGDGCPICKLIHNAGMLLQSISKIAISACAAYAAAYVMVFVTISVGGSCGKPSTFINAKVRLNI